MKKKISPHREENLQNPKKKSPDKNKYWQYYWRQEASLKHVDNSYKFIQKEKIQRKPINV